jgi:glycosyltransferase involved in cell wall biosynthesis
MKVLMVLTYYYPHWTGLTAYAQRLAEGLVERGHQVTVLTSRYHNDMAAEEMHNGVRIVRIPSLLRLSRGRVMPNFPFAFNRLIREHDVVQAHIPMLETWLVGALAHRVGRKMVMTNHGDLVMPDGLFNQIVQKIVGFMLDRGAASADVITTHSRDYAEHSAFMRPYLHKVAAICPTIESERPDAQAVAAWRRELGLEGRPIVGFAGRFVEEKGFDYLLKAIPHVIERIPHVVFAYAGEHNVVYENFFGRWQHLFDAYRDHIVMMGLITDRQKLANFYAMCDVFALPSRTDCFPSVQIEAMLCGTPVVASNIPGARQAVLRSGMGRLVEPRDERSLAQGLIDVLSSPQEYTRPYELIRAVFDPQRSIDEYERLFDCLIRGVAFEPAEEVTCSTPSILPDTLTDDLSIMGRTASSADSAVAEG